MEEYGLLDDCVCKSNSIWTGLIKIQRTTCISILCLFELKFQTHS